ncbi:MAG: c-type cytochrome biogenesis protein CcmI [Burkholderiaceae bacterium]|nr:c-type cytochrome biogenesis protein CcmI [Burkholderiaceae bacterium]
MLFWCCIAFMILVLLGAIAWGLLKPIDRKREDHPNMLNRLVYQDQIDELKRELDRKAISTDTYSRSIEEIERRIINETSVEEVVTRDRLKKQTLIVLFTTIPVVALILYFQIGNPSLSNYFPSTQSGTFITEDNRLDREEMVSIDESTLKKYLKESPNDVRAWLTYARILENQKKWREALEVMDRVFELSPNKIAKNSSLILEKVFLMLQTEDPLYKNKIEKELERAIEEDPNNIEVWEVSGMVAYKNGQYNKAVEAWTKLLSFYPSGSPQSIRLLDAIGEAQNRAFMSGSFR